MDISQEDTPKDLTISRLLKLSLPKDGSMDCGPELPTTIIPSQIPSLIKSQAAWRESSTWLGDHYLASLVQECISHLPWIRPIEASFCFTINDLSPLLSDQWLSDEHIDFFASLFGKAASDGSLSIIITTLAFSRAIPGRPQVSA